MSEVATEEKDLGTLDLATYKQAQKAPAPEAEEKPVVESESTTEKPKPKGKGGFQARIDRFIKLTSTLETQLAQEKKAREAAEARLNGKAPEAETKQVASDGEPQREAFDSDAEYFKAVGRWSARQEMAEVEKEKGRKKAEEDNRAVNKAHNERVIETRVRVPDWDEVINAADFDIPKSIGPAILRMANGPDVMYHLAKNPDLVQEMMEMDDVVAIGKVWEIARELKTEDAEEEEPEESEEETEEKEEAKPEKKRVPAPIKPVGTGSSKTSTVPLDKAPLSVYRKDYERRVGRGR